jgi:site-specific DNA recombinase
VGRISSAQWHKIARYRAALDAGGDRALVAEWISETATIKKATRARLGLTEAPPERMSEE